jgi:hypothetical protein
VIDSLISDPDDDGAGEAPARGKEAERDE